MSDNKASANLNGALRPMPMTLVSCRYNGEDNALAIGYCTNCSFDPPMIMIGITPGRYSHKMVKESGCFVLNLPENDLREAFDYLGSKSRANEDKLKVKNVKTEDAKTIDAPILSDCPVNIECTVVNSVMAGSHEIFFGKVEYVHVRKDLLMEDGRIDFAKLDLLK